MTRPKDNIHELCELLWTVRDGTCQPEDIERLEQLAGDDPEVQKLCARFAVMCGLMHWARRRPCVVTAPGSAKTETSPSLGFLGNAFHGTVGYFSQVGPLSYLIAVFIMLLMGVAAWSWKLPDYTQVAHTSLTPAAARRPERDSQIPFVGRVTGMVDCQWVHSPESRVPSPALDPRLSTLVSLGDKYALSSGLMEITYDTGAKVILQGPMTYEVESLAGGYLSVGKLTARVESTEKTGSANHPISNSQSPIPNPSLPTTHHPLFTIRTPTATVTDLGTEFGVEVSKEGNTISRVFRGSVEIQTTSANGASQAITRVLHENESASVEAIGSGSERRLTMLTSSPTPTDFLRTLPKAAIKTFDLVDVVAGGNGFSGRRNAGIDPTNGRVTDEPPASADFLLVDDGTYHRVDGLPFVDGVFVPDNRRGPVQIDSAGHTFVQFRTSDNRTSNHLWAGGTIPLPLTIKDKTAIPLALGDVDYSSSGHGLLYMHANKGITFDLDAIRRANPGCKILRFRAVAGNTEPYSVHGEKLSADLAVFVDGQMRLERRDVSGINGAIWVVVPIADKDRFLTLAATDGGNGIVADIVIFGDPRLEMLVMEHGQ